MPNYVENVLIITGDDIDIDKLKYKLNVSNVGDEIDDFFDLFIKNKNVDADIISWSVTNWGTKWDVCDCEVSSLTPFTLKFRTAWSPPITFFKKFSANHYPSLKFTLAYIEIGEQFYGMIKLKNNVVVSEFYKSINEDEEDDENECIFVEDDDDYEKYNSNPDYLNIDNCIFLCGNLKKFYEKYGFRSLGG